MQFFSLYDLLLNRVRESNSTLDEMYAFFRTRNVKKVQITQLQQTAYIPSDKSLKKAVCDFLNMTELEIELSMGKIPASYRESYFHNIKKIAQLLSKTKDNIVENYIPYYKNEHGRLYNEDLSLIHI